MADELDMQLDTQMPVQWIESVLSMLDSKVDTTGDNTRCELDENLSRLKKHLRLAEGQVLYTAACLPLVNGLVLGVYNQLSYLVESFLTGHTLEHIPWRYTPSLTLMRYIIADPDLTARAKAFGGELGEGLMGHIQDLLDTNISSDDWAKMYRLLQDISQRQGILPRRYFIAPNKVRLKPNSRPSIGGEATVAPATMKGKRNWKDVVIRIPHPSTDNVDTRTETRLQAIAHHQLKHENIVPCLGVVALNDTLAIVMPWQENGNVMEFLKTYKGCDKDKVTLDLLIDAASGLAHMHNMRSPIVHGDPKGENILVSSTLKGMLCDFGRTRVLHQVQRSRSTASPGGSVRYLPPEMVKSKKAVRPTIYSDCYAFAMVIIELTTLQDPFCEWKNTLGVGAAVVKGHRPRRPEVGLLAGARGEPIWRLVEELWHATPGCRPPMQKVVDRLQTCRRNCFGPS